MDIKKLCETPQWDWPEGTDQMLLETMQNNTANPEERELAVRLAGETVVVNDEIVDALLSILHTGDESEEMRGLAAISLGPALEEADMEIDDDPDDMAISEEKFSEVKTALKAAYANVDFPEHVRRKVLEASVRTMQDWHANAVRAAYRSNDSQWKVTGIFCMGFVPGFDEEILESLDSEDPLIRYQAVVASGSCEVEEAWPHVKAILTSSNPDRELLLAAIEASAWVNPKDAGKYLVKFGDSKDEEIAETADEAMINAEGLSGDVFDDEDFDF